MLPTGKITVAKSPATVLVVDNKESICEIVTRFLEDDGPVCSLGRHLLSMRSPAG